MQRGEVFRFKISKGLGHEQHGGRYAVVVQADEFLPRSIVIVAPTSRRARKASFRPPVQVEGETTLVLVEQLNAVDVQRLGKRTGRLSIAEMWSVDEALATYVGLRHL